MYFGKTNIIQSLELVVYLGAVFQVVLSSPKALLVILGQLGWWFHSRAKVCGAVQALARQAVT